MTVGVEKYGHRLDGANLLYHFTLFIALLEPIVQRLDENFFQFSWAWAFVLKMFREPDRKVDFY
jgi:hypothetical protein